MGGRRVESFERVLEGVGRDRLGLGWYGGWSRRDESVQHTNFVRVSAHELCGGLHSFVVQVCGLLGNIVGSPQLDIGVLKVVLHSVARDAQN